jgi:hypothetical protein
MLKRIMLLVLSFVSLSASALAVQAPVSVSAATPQDEVCKGIGAADGSGGCSQDGMLTSVVRNVINIFSIVIGIVAVIMIMVGGFKYITAAGDSGNITSAKQTVIYALIGLVVAALAQFLVQFVLDNI